MKNTTYVIKGDFVYSRNLTELEEKKNAYLVCVEGKSKGVYDVLPKEYENLDVIDCSGHLIIPGLTDLHIHAPQYGFRGLWMDMELLDWLNCHTFPEESKYQDEEYARKAYSMFVEDLKKSATTRVVAFGTMHRKATEILMQLLEESGLQGYVGKVNMDRNSPDILCETSAEEAGEDTMKWLQETGQKFKNIKPIITPRFIPTCSDQLMIQLGELVKESHYPVQSHLSENQSEIEWVKELCPWSANYADAYEHFGVLGEYSNTIMAHCVWCTEEERELLKKRKTFVAHCPSSNANLSSGIAPIRAYLEDGLKIGLGTDVAGGSECSLFKVMVSAVQMSKLYWRLVDDTKAPLSIPEVFYMASLGGGSFFGKVGSFEEGFACDALVLDESKIPTPIEGLSLGERLERFIYLADDRDIMHKFVEGVQLF